MLEDILLSVYYEKQYFLRANVFLSVHVFCLELGAYCLCSVSTPSVLLLGIIPGNTVPFIFVHFSHWGDKIFPLLSLIYLLCSILGTKWDLQIDDSVFAERGPAQLQQWLLCRQQVFELSLPYSASPGAHSAPLSCPGRCHLVWHSSRRQACVHVETQPPAQELLLVWGSGSVVSCTVGRAEQAGQCDTRKGFICCLWIFAGAQTIWRLFSAQIT